MVTKLQLAVELKPCIVRIRRSNGTVVGVGFLVGEKHILTCAHVVAEALGLAQDHLDQPEERVQLDFPLLALGKHLTAQVVMWQPSQPDGRGDIAGLELDTPPPPEASPAHLVAAENLWGHSFRAFGFPRGSEDGAWASGTLLDRQAAGWVQIEDVKETGYGVQPGFSGTPVWNNDLGGVVGMVVAAEARAEIKAAFTIPTDVLLASWPEMDQLAPLPCPYQGLRAFQQQHASYFFGRERFIEQLVRVVQERSLTAVVGPSGSGKSSVVFAGLLPRLCQEGNWVIVSCRPGREPFQELATSLIPSLEPQVSETDRLIERNKLSKALRLGEVHIHEVLERILGKHAEASRLLLVCDQFEELYTLGQDAEDRSRYLDELLQAVAALSQHREPPFSLVLTLRADFFAHASSYRPFADALQGSMLILGRMNRKELQDAIEKPARLLGVRIEEGLGERLLEAVGEEPGNLPLLEFALTQLWSRRRHGMLTHVAYDEIGGVKQALAVHAEAAFCKLDPQEEQQVRRIFTQLVQPSQATEDTRRIATESELGPENWGLVARLADARLVVTGRDEVIGEETAETAHEALIREWERLREWMNEEREFRQWQERLRLAMRQWEMIGRDNGALLRGGVLAEAERWLGDRGGELAEAERDYICTSIGIQEQERVASERRRRWQISGRKIEQARKNLFINLFSLKPTLMEICREIEGKLGFEFAAIQLVHPERQISETAHASNIASVWAGLDKHHLDIEEGLRDIQADIYFTKHTEIISEWDPRFHNWIYDAFHHDRLVRVFTPIVLVRDEGGKVVDGWWDTCQWKVIGDFEKVDHEGRRKGYEIALEIQGEKREIEVIGTVEAGVGSQDSERPIEPQKAEALSQISFQASFGDSPGTAVIFFGDLP
jgi:KaiC/GvpD/RAD55 family RecA-like ATPase